MITHMQVNVKKLHENAVLPTYGSTNAAGADLYACIDAPLTIAPHETVMVHTGLAMEIPEGYAGLVYARSGLAAKRHLAPANKVGVVDTAVSSWLLYTITATSHRRLSQRSVSHSLSSHHILLVISQWLTN